MRRFITGGARLYFTEVLPAGRAIVQVPASAGEAQPIPAPFERPNVLDLNARRAELLVAAPSDFSGQAGPLRVLPLSGGPPRRFGDALAQAAAWSPHGRSLAFASGPDLYVGNNDASEIRKIASVPGVAWPLRWSADGKRLRITFAPHNSIAPRIWELSADGSGGHELLVDCPVKDSVRGWAWTPGGDYFLFSLGQHAHELCRSRRKSPTSSRRAATLPAGQFRLTFGSVLI